MDTFLNLFFFYISFKISMGFTIKIIKERVIEPKKNSWEDLRLKRTLHFPAFAHTAQKELTETL